MLQRRPLFCRQNHHFLSFDSSLHVSLLFSQIPIFKTTLTATFHPFSQTHPATTPCPFAQSNGLLPRPSISGHWACLPWRSDLAHTLRQSSRRVWNSLKERQASNCPAGAIARLDSYLLSEPRRPISTATSFPPVRHDPHQ